MADQFEQRDTSHAMLGLNDTATRHAAPPETGSIYQSGPQPGYLQGSSGSGKGTTGIKILIIVLLMVCGVNLYLALVQRSEFKESLSKHADQLNLLTRRLDTTDERYAQLGATFQVTSKKLGLTQQELSRARSLAADIQKEQQATVQQLNTAISQKASTEELNKLQADANAKFSTFSSDLAGTRKDLEDTKTALTGAKGELTGAIARTHDELVELAHRTDRDYFEFNVARRGARQKVGPVTVELTRTNPKKNQFTLNLYFDDKRTERKDKSVNEPVYFYVRGAANALELVVNKLSKDSVAGYISAPKGFLADVPNVLSARPGA